MDALRRIELYFWYN